MVAIFLTIAASIVLVAWMSHGDEGNWFKGTLTHAGVLVLVVGVVIAIGWVMEYGT